MMKTIKFIFLYIYDTIYWFFSDVEMLLSKTFKVGVYKPEICYTTKWECGCGSLWNKSHNWSDKCSLHNKKIIEIKAHTSWHNAWKYLFKEEDNG